jgi:hypothetical protein
LIIERYHDTSISREYKNENNINELFNVKNFQELFEKLQGDKSELAQGILKTMQEQCPLSLRVIYEQLTRGKSLNLMDCFKMDFGLTQR